MNLKNLTDNQLILSTKTAADVETKATTNVVRHFMEIYLRGLHLALGYGSIWEMAKKEFGYDNASITRRTNAMELALTVPSVLEKIDNGEIGLQTAADIQSFLNRERGRKKPYSRKQKEELVEQCSGLSCLEVQIELASRNPDMKLKESKRFVSKEHVKVTYTTKLTTEEKVERVKSLLSHVNPYMTRDELTDFMAEKTLDAIDPARRDLRRERREAKKKETSTESITVTYVSTETASETVATSKAVANEKSIFDPVLGSVPNLDRSASVSIRLRNEIVSEFGEIQLAVDFDSGAAVENRSAVTTSMVDSDLKTSPSLDLKSNAGSVQNLNPKRSRLILAKDKRAVRMANQNQGCEYVNPATGRRCGSKHQLQFDHVIEHSKGGSNEAANLRVYCAQHNRFRSRQNARSQVRCMQSVYG